MSSTDNDDTRSLLLHCYHDRNPNFKFRTYAGGGRAGYVFKVNIGDDKRKAYALKMFKFYHPELAFSRLRGLRRRAFFDPFFIECRANGSLIQQGLNGQITPFCHGWVEVSTADEIEVARKFNIQPFLWDRPTANATHKVRGILFEWIDGEELSRVPINQKIATQARASITALHDAGIIHNDLAASNVLVQSRGLDQRVCLLDLSASITLPHVKFKPEDLGPIRQEEKRLLEVGFVLLSKLPINKGLCVANMSSLRKSMEEVITEYCFLQYLWTPPRPTRWQGNHA